MPNSEERVPERVSGDSIPTTPSTQEPEMTMGPVPVTIPDVEFTWREWLTCLLALGLAWLWFSAEGFMLPGLGATLICYALLGASLIVIGRNIRIDRVTVSFFIAIIALAAIPAIFADMWLRLFDLLLLAWLCPMEIFLLSGLERRPWYQPSIVIRTVGRFIFASFKHLLAPIHAFPRMDSRHVQTLTSVLIGLMSASIVFAIILPLLASADSVFASLFEGLFDWTRSTTSWNNLWETLRVLILAPVVFSFLFSLNHTAKQKADDKLEGSLHSTVRLVFSEPGSSIPIITILALLDLLYLFFVSIQFAFLFGGAQSAAMQGGYAEYARSGFFQLVAVTIINLVIVLGAVWSDHNIVETTASRTRRVTHRSLQVLCMLLIALAGAILISAAWRMHLYVAEYGLTLLRASTLLAMVIITICLIAAATKVMMPSFPFFGVFLVSSIGLWLVFNYANADAQIADYNVDEYMAGRVKHIDIDYLADLSPAVIPALERLADADTPKSKTARSAVEDFESQDMPPWQFWNWGEAHYLQVS